MFFLYTNSVNLCSMALRPRQIWPWSSSFRGVSWPFSVCAPLHGARRSRECAHLGPVSLFETTLRVPRTPGLQAQMAPSCFQLLCRTLSRVQPPEVGHQPKCAPLGQRAGQELTAGKGWSGGVNGAEPGLVFPHTKVGVGCGWGLGLGWYSCLGPSPH